MNLNFLSLLAFLTIYSGSAFATEYIYRDLMANTLPSPKCEAKTDAIASASKSSNFDRHSKKFCQTQGYGWHLTEVKNSGNSVCEECSDRKGEYRCYFEDVVVQCTRLKPGSAGLIPGKS